MIVGNNQSTEYPSELLTTNRLHHNNSDIAVVNGHKQVSVLTTNVQSSSNLYEENMDSISESPLAGDTLIQQFALDLLQSGREDAEIVDSLE